MTFFSVWSPVDALSQRAYKHNTLRAIRIDVASSAWLLLSDFREEIVETAVARAKVEHRRQNNQSTHVDCSNGWHIYVVCGCAERNLWRCEAENPKLKE